MSPSLPRHGTSEVDLALSSPSPALLPSRTGARAVHAMPSSMCCCARPRESRAMLPIRPSLLIIFFLPVHRKAIPMLDRAKTTPGACLVSPVRCVHRAPELGYKAQAPELISPFHSLPWPPSSSPLAKLPPPEPFFLGSGEVRRRASRDRAARSGELPCPSFTPSHSRAPLTPFLSSNSCKSRPPTEFRFPAATTSSESTVAAVPVADEDRVSPKQVPLLSLCPFLLNPEPAGRSFTAGEVPRAATFAPVSLPSFSFFLSPASGPRRQALYRTEPVRPDKPGRTGPVPPR